MRPAAWHPATYLQFADERSRPFVDLTSRVGASRPCRVVDLGCGPGQLTATLADRWPEAEIVGVDNSEEMISSARQYSSGGLSFSVADIRNWRPQEPVDVIISNAALQWVPEHRSLLPRLADGLAPDGWLAFQVPGNFGEPSHRLLRECAADPRFSGHCRDVEVPDASGPETYLADLVTLGFRVDAWETTYLHLLTGQDAVFRWISGTGARPVLQALPEPLRAEFEREYKELLNRAYPPRSYGTVLPFRRVFVVAQKVAEPAPDLSAA
ncbi:methyltransferase domain-containing protein [Microlunatus panaciterrae]|uniref:Trans-aconitate 2-methyltransferase n=1 Tax=Microlunatus panaciterrae TaxID=400768 RepID=A0ABS2RN34_9ACTN|nr:trans-aconitate 2-methyltransferase [Microlunatus panaciterrae]MBM7800400.1 trans-aconitate 2-methyltransferase [Microlunatus panaciterrae]